MTYLVIRFMFGNLNTFDSYRSGREIGPVRDSCPALLQGGAVVEGEEKDGGGCDREVVVELYGGRNISD